LSEFVPFQSPNKEKSQRRHPRNHGIHSQLAFLQQVRLITSQLVRAKLIRRLSEVIGKSSNDSHVGTRCAI
jgi:hypothetical protein